jgi:hypothetical protein
MTDTTTSHATNDTGGQRDYDQVLADAVAVLTEAARRTTTRGRGTSSEQQDQADFADFLATALAGAAANLGGIEALLAGRPGSWEADYVRQLLVGTVGDDERLLWGHRTDPLVIRVHADDILNDLGYWTLFDEAADELDRRDDAICARHDTYECVEDYGPDDQAAIEEIEQLRDALDRQWQQDRAAYGQAFAGHARQAARELFPGLQVPVEVIVETGWQNNLGPAEAEWDGPEWRIWETARQNTPLPGSGIPLRDYPLTLDVAQVERDAGRTPLARLDEAQAGHS